jgi:HrpA-like RNA helicase
MPRSLVPEPEPPIRKCASAMIWFQRFKFSQNVGSTVINSTLTFFKLAGCVQMAAAAPQRDTDRKLFARDKAGEESAALPTLPIHAVKDKILKLVADNQIVVITGDTVPK